MKKLTLTLLLVFSVLAKAEMVTRPQSMNMANNGQQSLQRFDTFDAQQQQLNQLRGQVELLQHHLDELVVQQERLMAMISKTKTQELHPNALASTKQRIEPSAALTDEEKQRYQLGYKLLKNKEYSQATVALHDYLRVYPNGRYVANSHYWLGELLLLEGNTPAARRELATVIENHPGHSKVPDAMVKLGFIYFDEAKWSLAKSEFIQVAQNYPESSAAQIAQQRLNEIARLGY